MQQSPPVRRRKNRNRVGCPGGAQVRSLERIDCDVDLGEADGPRSRDVLRVDHADLLADIEHRRLVALPFADHDGAIDWHGVHHPAHRLDGGLVGFVTIALPHRVRARDGRLFDHSQELERKI